MVRAPTQITPQLAYLESFQKGFALNGPVWLQRIRAEGMACFEEKGFPTHREEDWKYTNVAPIAKATFTPSWDCIRGEEPRFDIGPFTFGEPNWSRLVFVNGVYSEALSCASNLPEGVRVTTMADAIARESEVIEEHLSRYASYHDNAFTALNTAFIHDGAFIYVPEGKVVEEPIHLLFVAAGSREAIVSHPRNLVIVGRGSTATIIESYVCLSNGAYFNNAVTEIVTGSDTQVEYYKLQRESETAFHVGTTQVHQGRDSRFSSFYLDIGAKLARHNLNVLLDGNGSECNLDGLYFVTGEQHIDNHTMVDHLSSHTTSRQLYKGILGGRSRAVFNGKVVTRKGTIQVDANQTNKNLLLSDYAQANTKPQLEIFADDVKCGHGATVGQLDEDAVFYMNSRGIDHENARTLLTYGFARDVVDRIRIERVRAVLDDLVLVWLQRDLATKETR